MKELFCVYTPEEGEKVEYNDIDERNLKKIFLR